MISFRNLFVAPFAGAWIEILNTLFRLCCHFVAPFAGAWIEIEIVKEFLDSKDDVAPFAGAWIEITDCR